MFRRSPLIIHYGTSQLVWLVLIMGLILFGAALAGFIYGNKTYSDNQDYIAELEIGIDELSEGLVQKQTALAALQLTAQVDASALEQTRQQLLDMQRQIYRREQELTLYREMLQDNNKTTGLKVGDIHIEKVGNRQFQYDWVAQQKNHEAKNLRVNAKIWVLGLQNDQPISIPLNEIDAEVDDLPIQLKMKYFSINRGIMTLPEGFVPQQIRLTLRYPWTEKPQFDKKLPWIVEE
jgi:hypothetical protein